MVTWNLNHRKHLKNWAYTIYPREFQYENQFLVKMMMISMFWCYDLWFETWKQIIGRFNQIRGRGSHDANHHRGTKLGGGQPRSSNQVKSTSPNTRGPLVALFPRKFKVVPTRLFQWIQWVHHKFNCHILNMATVPTFHQSGMADWSVSYDSWS